MATVNFITFNQDHSCLAVGTSRGFRIYYTDPFSKCYESKDGDISLVEMLFSTSLVALILSPRRLQITNTKRASTICELTFPSSVLAVRLNRKRLVVVLEGEIYLYDISNMKLAHTIETSPNPQAICALSSSSESCYLAYPLPQKAMPTSFAPPSHAPPSSGATNAQFIAPTTGDVLLFDALKQEAINVIPAHRSPLSCLALSADGKLLATASDKGTIIRVFSVPDAQKLFQFRRGTYPSRIYSMAFNATNTLLCVSSATDTVHIFRLSASPNPPPPNRPDSPIERGRLRDSSPAIQSIASTTTTQDPSPSPDTPSRKHNGSFGSIIRRSSQTLGKSFAQSVGGYLPTAVTEMWEPARDFAYCKIPKSALAQSPGPGGAPLQQQTLGGAPLRSVVAISSSSPQVMVVTSEGLFYVFNVDMEAGGEGVLCKQYSLVEEMGSLGDE